MLLDVNMPDMTRRRLADVAIQDTSQTLTACCAALHDT